MYFDLVVAVPFQGEQAQVIIFTPAFAVLYLIYLEPFKVYKYKLNQQKTLPTTEIA